MEDIQILPDIEAYIESHTQEAGISVRLEKEPDSNLVSLVEYFADGSK